jgi:mycothiol maleylpyruvate isomerase-like protein
METSELRAAYDRFLRTALSSADCEAADDAGWTVAMVVAHVAANDRLIAAHLRRAMAGEPTAYDNRTVYRASELQPLVDADSDVRSQIDDARRSSSDVLALAGQMDEGVAALVFQTNIMDGDIVQLDGPVPLAGLLGAQVRVHLPLHTAQIEALAAA